MRKRAQNAKIRFYQLPLSIKRSQQLVFEAVFNLVRVSISMSPNRTSPAIGC